MQQYLRNRQKEFFTPEKNIRGHMDLIDDLSSGNVRALLPPMAFEKMRMPLEYSMYCTPAWRIAQKVRAISAGRKHGI